MEAKSKVSQPRFVDSWTPHQAWFSSVTDGNQGKCRLCRDMLATLLQAFSEPVKENGPQRRIPNEQVRCWKIPIFLLNFFFLYVYILIKNGCVEIDIPLKFTVKSSFFASQFAMSATCYKLVQLNEDLVLISTGKVSYSTIKDSMRPILQPFIKCHFRELFHCQLLCRKLVPWHHAWLVWLFEFLAALRDH